jgi:hypothetical protein
MLRTGNGIDPSASPTLGDLLTNAKKVTVSVLYWYEELSSLLTEIFKLILKRIKIFFIIFIFISVPLLDDSMQASRTSSMPLAWRTRYHYRMP